MWFNVKCLHLSYALHSILYHHHDFVKTSLRHCQDTSIIPRRMPDICLSHIEGSRAIIDSQNTSLTVSRCSAHYSLNRPLCIIEYSAKLWRYFPEYSSKVRRYIACLFSRGTTRSMSAPIAARTRIFHRQYIARHVGSRGTIASGYAGVKA